MPKFYLNYHILQEILKRLDLELVPRGFGILRFYSGKGWKVPSNFALFFRLMTKLVKYLVEPVHIYLFLFPIF